MKLKATITVPELRLVIKNEREVVAAMASTVADSVKARAVAGTGLPSPKDGGRAYNRSGTLTASIGFSEPKQTKSGVWRSIVRAYGARPVGENVAKKVSRARERTKALRASAILGASLRSLAGQTVAGLKKTGAGIKLARIRVRAGMTNAAVAAILSVEPKDKRSVAGGRKIYRVFEALDREARAAERVARATMKPVLEATGRAETRSTTVALAPGEIMPGVFLGRKL